MGRVLIVDDEPALCWSLSELVRDLGHLVQTAGSIAHARECLNQSSPDILVLDVRMPDGNGLDVLSEFRQRCPNAAVIVMTAFGDLSTVTTALSGGVFEYLVKPFDLKSFASVIERALVRSDSAVPAEDSRSESRLVGRSSPMQSVFRQIALVAPTPFPVLLLGETGTGKDVAARAIHEHSRVAQGPFVPVSPAALNSALIESELFGHVRGAFTGAADRRPGYFELANGGTLFLDEIAETPLPVQAKLLRVLETRGFCPVGSGTEQTTTARFVAATHRNLREAIRKGTFREDLFHRLSSFSIILPALRDRQDDIPSLVEHFVGQLDSALQPAGYSHEFLDALVARRWSGNVRELRNAIEHAVVVARGQSLKPDHLPLPAPSEGASASDPEREISESITRWAHQQIGDGAAAELYRRATQILDSSLIPAVLEARGKNRTAAARILGLDRSTLRAKLRDISDPEQPDRDGESDT